LKLRAAGKAEVQEEVAEKEENLEVELRQKCGLRRHPFVHRMYSGISLPDQ